MAGQTSSSALTPADVVQLESSTQVTAHRKARARGRLAARLRARRKPVVWIGAGLVAAGAAAVAFPGVGPVLVGAAAGWLLWLAGAAMLAVSLLLAERGFRLGGAAAGLLTAACGAFLFFNPIIGALAATVLATAGLVIEGAFELAMALRLRPLAAWRWVVASALASGVAAILVAAGAAGWSAAALPLILGLAFGSSGLALMALGLRARRPRRRS